MLAAVAYWYKTRPALGSEEAAAGEVTDGWTGPQVDMAPVWNSCYAACDAGKGFFEKYVAAPPSKEA